MSNTSFKLTTEEIIELFSERLPAILEERPELEPQIYRAFLKSFATKEEVAMVLQTLNEFREETQANFARLEGRMDRFEGRLGRIEDRVDKLEKRVDSLEETVKAGFRETQRLITQLGSRWGIYNESIWRDTIATILEKSYGATVETKVIDGEQFDVIISNGEHILLEITARAKSNIQERLERKRAIYTEKVTAPARFIFAVASIYSTRAQALREAGFEVVEPAEDIEDW